MGGADLLDSLIRRYKIKIRTKNSAWGFGTTSLLYQSLMHGYSIDEWKIKI
jgi:hypothetical protein